MLWRKNKPDSEAWSHHEPRADVDKNEQPENQERHSVKLDEFLEIASWHISESSNLWRDEVLARVNRFQSDESRMAMSQAVEAVYGDSMPSGKIRVCSDSLLSRLISHSIIIARYISVDGLETQENQDGEREIVSVEEDVLKILTEIDDEETKRVLKHIEQFHLLEPEGQAKLIVAMHCADGHQQEVMKALVGAHMGNRDLFEDIKNKEAPGQIDERQFCELKKMISCDWHHPQSILKTYLDYLNEHPDHHLEAFAEAVSSVDRIAPLALEYAKFALSYSGEAIDSETVKSVIVKTYQDGQWEEVPRLKKEFDKFVKKEEESIRCQLSELAGHLKDSDVRKPRSLKEASESKALAKIDTDSSSVRRRKGGSRKKRGVGEGIVNVSEALSGSGLEREGRVKELAIPKRIEASKSGDNTKLIGTDLDGIIDALDIKVRDGNGLESDVRKMIEYLFENPINPGSKRLSSGQRNSLVIDGVRHLPARFKPQHAPGLGKINNKDVRIVYAIVEDKLVIISASRHSEFDKKY